MYTQGLLRHRGRALTVNLIGKGPGADPGAPVAIIGLGCVLPDAPDVASFWKNLLEGRSSIREVPRDRWLVEDYFSVDRSLLEKTYSKIGSFVDGFDFNWRKYKIPPNVARHMDANQKWGIEAADQCLRDGGYDRRPFDRKRTAVIVGNTGGGEIRIGNTMRIYFPAVRRAVLETDVVKALSPAEREAFLEDIETRFKTPLQPATEDTMPGELANLIPGRISNAFDLAGPNFAVDAACASNAAAFDIALQYLRGGDVDMVIAGAVDASQNVAQFIKFSKIGALSPDGCFPFDERANGFVMGEGAVLFLLKRLSDAQRDGDRIYGVIRGVGASSDGRGHAVTAPTVEGQVLAIERAWRDAGADPATVGYIECHGTGTRLGDHVELEALQRTYGKRPQSARPIPIGTVKSNLGHLKSAAGAVGLLKTLLALQHGVIPPTLNHARPIPPLQGAGPQFTVATAARPWPLIEGVRRAAVSSFGFGGSNFHVILEAAGPAAETAATLSTPALRSTEVELGLDGLVRRHAEAVVGRSLAPSGSLMDLTPSQRMELVSRLRSQLRLPRIRIPLSGAQTIAELASHIERAQVESTLDERSV